jgi:hypothetical protein
MVVSSNDLVLGIFLLGGVRRVFTNHDLLYPLLFSHILPSSLSGQVEPRSNDHLRSPSSAFSGADKCGYTAE